MRQKLLCTMKALLVVAMLGGLSLDAWAIPTVFKTYDFDAATDAVSDQTVLSYSGTTKIGSTDCDNLSGSFEGISVQGAGGWHVYHKNQGGTLAGKGYYNNNGGGRLFGLLGLKEGDIVTITVSGGLSTSATNATYDSENSTSTTGIFTMTTDGNFAVSVVRYNYIHKVTIAREYANVITADFENSGTYTNGWTVSNTTTSQLDISGNKKILFRTNKDKTQSTETYDFSSIVSGTTADYILSFDYAFTPTGSSQLQETVMPVLEVYSGTTQLFRIECGGSGGSGVTMSVKNASGTTIGSLTSQERFKNPEASHFYTFTITGNSTDGTTLSIKNSSGAAVALSNSVLNASFLLADKIVSNLHKTSGQEKFPSLAAFDNIIFNAELDNLKSRATTAIAAYTAIKDEIMNSTVYATLDGAHTALASFSEDASILANGGGYLASIIALENAIPDAEESAADFKLLNQLISNANSAALAGYDAPIGATAVYTENADVDAATLITNIRTAITTAGTANENTDITALIVNNSFELGNTYGWTTVASNDTGARNNDSPYTTTDIDGSWQFNTWSQGTPIAQNIGMLPEGQYKLACKVASDGGTVYLTVNDNHNTGTVTTSEGGGTYVDAEYIFSLGETTEVTIGAVGSNDDGSFTADGHWWYKADKFTLTYLGEDLLEKAKTDLKNEINAATTVKNAWSPKVGTTSFKYSSTKYDILVSELSDAAEVAASGSTTVSDYTAAKDDLEAAKDDMANSTQNLPDPDKYYRIFVANNDGTASAYNLNMLYETTKTQVTASATPYPVKITKPDSYYRIETPKGSDLCTDYTATTTAYTNGWEGSNSRCSQLQFILNDNGSITIRGNRGSGTWHVYSASASEGATVTANTGLTGTWIISDAVEVTDVTLAVNAAAGWGTFIAPYDNLTPSTVKAYTVSYTNNNAVFLEENTTGVLSANTPYILSTEEADNVSSTFKGIANNEEDSYTANGLVGLLTASTVPADSYVLQYNDEEIGFYRTTSDITGTANRCFLDLSSVPTEPTSSRATISFGLYNGEANGIAEIEKVRNAGNEAFYNLNGQRIVKPAKGFYVVNGKKVIIK